MSATNRPARGLSARAAPLSLILALGCLALGLGSAAPPPARATFKAVIVGPARGELEPCGCSGGQFGGIDRVAAAVSFAAQSARGPVLRLASGGVVGERATVERDWGLAQLETLWMAYGQMDLAAVGLFADDLEVGLLALRERVALLGRASVVATNVVDAEGRFLFEPAYRDPGTGAVVLCFAEPGRRGDGWRTIEPAAALQRLEREGRLGPAQAGALVFVEGEAADAEAVAPAAPPGSVFLLSGAGGDPDHALGSLGGGVHWAGKLGERGRHLIELTPLPGSGYTWRDVPVSQSVPVLPEYAVYREQYRLTLEATDVVGQLADHLGAPEAGAYAGSELCGDCHVEAYEIWEETLHSHGLETLEQDLRGSANALSDPACLFCHSVGFGYETGWASARVPVSERRGLHGGLAGVGCESCHGPGMRHVESEDPDDILLSDAGTCIGCHDGENDPGFNFEKKWPQIEH